MAWLGLVACSGGDAPPTEPPPVTLTRVSVGPSGLSLEIGQTQQMSATAHYSDGSSQTLAVATWTSSAPAVATVSSSGLVTAVSVGDVVISATTSGQTGSQPVSVTGAWCEDPTPLSLEVGEHEIRNPGKCVLITAQGAGEYYRIAVTRPVSAENSSDVSTVILETRAGTAGRDIMSVAVSSSEVVSSRQPDPAIVRAQSGVIDGTEVIADLRMAERTRRAHVRMMMEAEREFGPVLGQAIQASAAGEAGGRES